MMGACSSHLFIHPISSLHSSSAAFFFPLYSCKLKMKKKKMHFYFVMPYCSNNNIYGCTRIRKLPKPKTFHQHPSTSINILENYRKVNKNLCLSEYLSLLVTKGNVTSVLVLCCNERRGYLY
ncbi:hypothetical protein ILYODFUR_033534 [Ilyodon furcidens]|uniref:Uncharacterized protein n=1 Tax=Ilyodon furcidens TaxID=33524 RepID=A0ABV0V8X9_9TELE